jgi:hypothetical protein
MQATEAAPDDHDVRDGGYYRSSRDTFFAPWLFTV